MISHGYGYLNYISIYIYFGSQGVLGINNYSNEKWHEINNDYIADYVEALTTISNYLCFSGIGENFQVFSLPDFKFVKELNYYAGGWGAAAYQDYLFVSPFEQEQDKDAFLLVDIEKEKIIRKYQFPEPPKDDCLLSAISCKNKFVVGFFEDSNFDVFYSYRDIKTGNYINQIEAENIDYTSPKIIKDHLLLASHIYDLNSSKLILSFELPEEEYICSMIENYIFTIDIGIELNKINIYSKIDIELIYSFELKAENIHEISNSANFFLIEFQNNPHYYLVSL